MVSPTGNEGIHIQVIIKYGIETGSKEVILKNIQDDEKRVTGQGCAFGITDIRPRKNMCHQLSSLGKGILMVTPVSVQLVGVGCRNNGRIGWSWVLVLALGDRSAGHISVCYHLWHKN